MMSTIESQDDNNFYNLLIYMCQQNLLKKFCFYMLHCEYHFTHTFPYNDYVVENIYRDLKKMYRKNIAELMFFNDFENLRSELLIILNHMENYMIDKNIKFEV